MESPGDLTNLVRMCYNGSVESRATVAYHKPRPFGRTPHRIRTRLEPVRPNVRFVGLPVRQHTHHHIARRPWRDLHPRIAPCWDARILLYLDARD